VQIYDVETCFDALWLHEVITCLYKAGIQNDKLPLLFLENQNAQVAAKVSNGLSQRVNIKQIIMQGSVWGSLCCVVLMDKLGKQVYNSPELSYYYKGLVQVPTLQMVDDILAVQKCSPQSRQLNTAVNTFIELEKLTLSKKKCHKIHVGKHNAMCPDLKVHGQNMHEATQETYLGDVIHKTGSCQPNIKARIAKGFGRVRTILTMLKESPLGWSRIKAGILLRQAMLINGMMFNSESWHGISQKQVEEFEQVDEALLRGLVDGHAKLPLAALYLELGQVPLRFILASRRILYLHTILSRDDEELTKKIYQAQKADPMEGDFSELVAEDIKMLDINKTDDEIREMNKPELKRLVKSKVRTAALQYLIGKRGTKMANLEYKELKTQSYLEHPSFPPNLASLLLALRTRTVRGIKGDFGSLYQDKNCPMVGCNHEDTLDNLTSCPVIAASMQTQSGVVYKDVFSQDMVKLKEAATRYTDLMEARRELLKEQTTPALPPPS
jgi:hypothetical protein